MGHLVTATATRNSSPLDTSEFSACRIVAADADLDGIPDETDNCTSLSNTAQTNSDTDPLGDTCDNCPNAANPGQQNAVHPGDARR